MTNEEAIKLLVDATYSDEWQGNEDLTTAHNMAIKALEQQSTLDKIRAKIKALSPEPTVYDVVGVDLDLVLKASQFAMYKLIEKGSKMFATGIGTNDCKTINWVDAINALADLREAIQ